MQRRTLLHVTAAALTTGLAGCGDSNAPQSTATATNETETTDNGTDTPTQTPTPSAAVVRPVRELWTAYNDENATGVVAAFHPDAPNPPEEGSVTFSGTVTVESTTVTDRTDEEATVDANLTLRNDGDTETQQHSYELRPDDGEWRVWSITISSTEGSEPMAPQISFGFDYDATATSGADTAVLAITHEAGDTADAQRLVVRGDGIVAPEGAQPDVTVSGVDWASASGTREVVAGSELTVGVESDCNISLVWASADGETSATLAQYEGPDA